MARYDRKPQTALICGASGGLGQVLARTLMANGMNVRGTMRDPSKNTASDISMLAMDVLDEKSVETCFEKAASELGSVDVVINCVNEMVLGSVEETAPEELQRVYAINVVGTSTIARSAIPLMRAQGQGLFVAMSSLGGILAVPYFSAYTSSKFALEAFAEALYHEVKADNIDVAIMQPVAMFMDRPDEGDHLKIAQGAPKDSPTRRMAAMMAKDTAESKLTPEIVSAAILDVIRSDSRKLRYPMDRAKILSVVKRLAPQALINKLIGKLVLGAVRS